MKKILIAHFSQSGSTEKVAEHIAAGFRDNKYAVDLHRIQDRMPASIDEYDLIGIGFPVYIFRVPFIVTEYIKNLPELDGKPFFIFMLYGTIRGTAGNMARRLMSQKGGREVGYSYYTGDDVYYGYLKKGYLFSPDHPDDRSLESASSLSSEIHEVLSGKDYKIPPYESLPGPVFTLERILTSRFLVNYLYRYFFHVSESKCISCGICAQNCPTGNIKYNRNGYPVFKNRCICCWYCEMKCPEEAISTPIDWPLLNLFNSYNIKKTLSDKVADYAMVKLSRGRVERIHEKKKT